MPRKIASYGWTRDHPDKRDRKWSAPMAFLKASPPRIDHRSLFPPVTHQLAAGCCTGESLAGHIHFRQLFDKATTVVQPSSLFLYYNGRLQDGTQAFDDGATLRDVIKGGASHGYTSNDCWPFDMTKVTKRPPKNCYKEASSRKLTEYRRLPQSLRHLKARIAEGGVISFGFAVYESFESDTVSKTGVLLMPGTTEAQVGGHAVLMVGYDDELTFPGFPAKGFFIIRNSWGQEWGDKGYFYMSYDFALDKDRAADFWTVLSVPSSPLILTPLSTAPSIATVQDVEVKKS